MDTINLEELKKPETLLANLKKKSPVSLPIAEVENFETAIDALNEARKHIEPFPLKCYIEESAENNFVLHMIGNENDPTFSLGQQATEKVFSRKKFGKFIYQWITGKYSIATLLLAFTFIGFERTFTVWLKATTIFVPIQNDTWLNWASLFLLFFSAFHWVINYQKRPSKLLYFFFMLFLVLFMYYRFYDTSFSFLRLWNGPIGIADLLFGVNTIGLLVAFFKTATFKKSDFEKWIESFYVPKKQTKEKEGFLQPPLLTDDPITSSEDDLLNRGKIALSIAEKIEVSTTENSFAIAIFDQWGNGKTSFMNMIERQLESQERTPIIVKFYPWFSEKKEKIVLDFFDVFQQEVGAYDASLGSELLKYAQKVSSISKDTFISTVTSLAELFTGHNIYQQYEQINQRIKSLNRKIVVFIDDLDRLHNDEVFEVLRIIRNTSNFYNTFFIVAASQEYLIHALKESKIHNPGKFHEKIFQLEYRLPPIPDYVLFDYLKNTLLKTKYPVEDKVDGSIKEEIRVFFSSSNDNGRQFNNDIFNEYFRNFREVNRFLNAFFQYYSMVAEEVVFSDFFYITLLKVKYHTVYNEISKNHKKYLGFDINKHALLALTIHVDRSKSSEPEIPLWDFLKSQGLSEAKSLFEKIFEDYSVGNPKEYVTHDSKTQKLDHIQKNFEKSVLNESNVRFYFQDGFLTETISNIQFRSLFNLEISSLIRISDSLPRSVFPQFYRKIKAAKLDPKSLSYNNWYHIFLYVLYQVNYLDVEKYRIGMLSFDAELLEDVAEGENSRYSFGKLTDTNKKELLFGFSKLISQKEGILDRFYWSIFELRSQFFYEHEIYQLSPNTKPYLSEKELRDLSILKLEEVVTKIEQKEMIVSSTLFSIQRACAKDVKAGLITLDERAFPKMKRAAISDPTGFLLHSIYMQTAGFEPVFYVRSWTAETFGGKPDDFSGFEKFLNDQTPHEVVDIFKAFYEQYKANGFKPVPLEGELAEKVEKLISDRDSDFLRKKEEDILERLKEGRLK